MLDPPDQWYENQMRQQREYRDRGEDGQGDIFPLRN